MMQMMITRALVIWFAIAVLAVLNGAFRESVLRRRLSEPLAHVTSTLILSGLIFAVSAASVRWIGVTDLSQAWAVGALWLVATLAFEFLAGHYLFKNPWEKIPADYRVTRGRVWLLVPICTLFAMPMAFTGIAPQYVIPYTISNAIAVTILVLAYTKSIVARWMIALTFGYAAIYNTWLGLTKPEEYQGFAELVLIDAYREIITGPFAANAGAFLVLIAIGQGIICITTALGGRTLWIGATGATLFLAGIAPFGVGSAFPFSVLVSLAAWVLVGSQRERAPAVAEAR